MDSYACTDTALLKITPSIDAANDKMTTTYTYSCQPWELNTENRSTKRPLCYTPEDPNNVGSDCAGIATTDGTTITCTAFPTACGTTAETNAMKCSESDANVVTDCQKGFFLINNSCLALSANVQSICNDSTATHIVVYTDYNLVKHHDCVSVQPTGSNHAAIAVADITDELVFTTIALNSAAGQG